MTPGSSFGIPDVEDPDPYGVKALESQGILIREAATHETPPEDVFEFKPAATSPIYANFARRSTDLSIKKRTSHRASMQSIATQTEEDELKTSGVSSPQRQSSRSESPAVKTTEHVTESGDEHDEDSPDPNEISRVSTPDEHDHVEVHEAQPVVAQAKMVQIGKRVPPTLPPRNPSRMSGPPPIQENDELEGTDGFSNVSLEPQSAVDGSALGEEQFHSTPTTPEKEEHESFA